MHELDSQTIDTQAGEYRVTWYADEFAEAPYDHGFHFAYDGQRDVIDVATDDMASEALAYLQDQVAGWNRASGVPYFKYSPAGIARYLRLKYGAKGVRIVWDGYHTSDATSTERDRIRGVAWAPDDATDPDKYTESAVGEYRAWAEGDCFGYTVTDPSGAEIGSCWGYYGFWEGGEREYTLSVAIDEANADAAERVAQANLVGAGIVGLV